MIFKTAPNTTKGWGNSLLWIQMNGLTKDPKTSGAHELLLQITDRERMIQQLAKINQSLSDAVKAIGWINSTLGDIRYYFEDISNGIRST